jgi:outer membrane immunogenic protein
MRRLSLAIFAAVSTIALSQIAFAADLPRKAPAYTPPPPPPIYNWSGFYVGGVGSYGWSQSRHCDDGGVFCTLDFDMNGWLGGLTLGYNWQLQNWVLGVEGDWSWGKIDGSIGDSDDFGCGGLCTTKIKSIGTIRGRVGYAFDRFLPYLTLGAAFTQLHSSLGSPVLAEDTTTKTDFVVGGGLEYAFLPNWSAKVEYLYITKLGDHHYDPANVADCDTECFSRIDAVNLVRFGVNYRFWAGR